DAGCSFDDLAERPEGNAVAVRQAPTCEPRVRFGPLQEGGEFTRQPRLATPGLACDRHEMRGALADDASVRVLEKAELVTPGAEDRDQGVREERLDRCAEAAQGCFRPFERRAEQRVKLLGISRSPGRELAYEHRDALSLLPRRDGRPGRLEPGILDKDLLL